MRGFFLFSRYCSCRYALAAAPAFSLALRRVVRLAPNGNKALYEYGGPEGRVSAVKVVIGGVTTTVASDVNYLPLGPVSNWQVGGSASHKRWFYYDTDRRLALRSSPAPWGTLSTITYGYNSADEVTRRNATVCKPACNSDQVTGVIGVQN